MSKYDKEREAMGIQPMASSSSTPSNSKYANERDTYRRADENKQYADVMKSAYENNPESFKSTAVAEAPAKSSFRIPALDWVNSKVGAVGDLLNRAAISAADTIGLGQVRSRLGNGPSFESNIFKENAAPADTTAEKAADIAGNLYGFLGPGTAAYGTGGRLAAGALSKLAPNAPKLIQALTKGAGAGLAYGTAREGLDAAVGQQDKSALDRLKGIGLDTALFAGGDVGLSLVGSGVKALASKYAGTRLGDFLGKVTGENVRPAVSNTDTLALPQGRGEARYQSALGRSELSPNVEPIIASGRVRNPEPLGLPEPKLAEPTRARVEARPNEYTKKFEDLVSTANQMKFTPGRELEELESLWSQMAGPKDPSLNDLIDLAYPKQVSKLSPESLTKARSLQQAREVAGVPNRVRSLNDRYQNEIGQAAAPRLSFEPKKSKYAAEREQILQETQAPPPIEPPAPVVPPKELPISRISAFGGKGGKFTNPEDTRTYIATKTDREPTDFSNLVNKFYEKNVDNLQRINQLDKQVESVTGQKLSPEERSYYQALNSRGSDMISNHILTERMVDSKGNVIGESLKDITKQIPRRSYTNFIDYLIAKHAPTRMARGETVYDKRTNMTPEKAEQKAADYEKQYPQFKQIADQLYAWNDKMVQAWLVDTGIISPEMAAAWKEQNPYWIPNKRAFSPLEKAGKFKGSKGGFSGQNNPVKKYGPGGSERPIIDPFESLIEYTDQYVKTAKRNEVMQTVIKNLQKDPESLEGFAKLVDENDFASQKSLKELNEALNKDGIEGLVDKLNADFEVAYNKPGKQRIGDKDNIITGMVDGKPVPIEVTDPALLDALTSLSPSARNAVVETVRSVTNAMKLLTTGINPIFSITRNIIRDIPSAYIFSKTTNNPFRFGIDLLDGIVSTFGNKELYQSYKALGGGHSSPVAADRNLLKQSKRELLPQQKKGLGLIPRAYQGLENLSNVIESAPRLGEFKRITKAGGNDYASKVKGLYEANDITTNFKKKGKFVKDADAFLPYLNAAVQGLDKSVRAFKDNPKAVAAKSALAITVPTLVLYALNHDNPDYQKLSNNVKDNFYLIPKGDGTFVKLPKPREYGVPFGSMLERIMRAWGKKDPDSFKGFTDTLRNAFVPPGANGLLNTGLPGLMEDTIGGPLVELAANKNFAGSPIVPEYLKGVSPRNQFDANTSEVSKKIGDVLNISPKQIDHLISSYTGVIGQLGIPATNEGATLGETLIKQVTADPAFSTDATKNFYDLKTKIDTMYSDAKLTGNIPKGYNDSARTYLSKTASDLSDVTKAIRAVDGMPLTPQQKKEKKRQLTELRNDTARKAYQTVQSALK